MRAARPAAPARGPALRRAPDLEPLFLEYREAEKFWLHGVLRVWSARIVDAATVSRVTYMESNHHETACSRRMDYP